MNFRVSRKIYAVINYEILKNWNPINFARNLEFQATEMHGILQIQVFGKWKLISNQGHDCLAGICRCVKIKVTLKAITAILKQVMPVFAQFLSIAYGYRRQGAGTFRPNSYRDLLF